MKVLLIIPSLGSGGAERVLSGLANDWVRNNKCDVEIILLMKVPIFYEIDHRIKIHIINYKGGSSLKFISLIKVYFDIRSLIKSISPDVCLSFIRETNILVLLSTFGLKQKIFISERDSPSVKISYPYRALRKLLYPKADGLIVQTQEYKNFILNEVGIVNQKVIPNPVRNIECTTVNREKIIISVGRLIPEKGHMYLLEAFSLCKEREGWILVIAGAGKLEESLLRRAKELNIHDSFILLGQVKDIDQWLCKSSIFAFTSISEGFPNALAEAMSASLACVSFNCITGPKELIKDGYNGFLVEVGNMENFSKKLDLLLSSKSLRDNLGRNAKESVERLKFDHVSMQYLSFLST